MPLISADQVRRVAPRAAPHIATAIVDRADDVLPRHGLATPLRLQHFMAQVVHESVGLTALEEGLSYTAARAHQVWPRWFPTAASAKPYAHRPRELADRVYGGRMGNRPGTDDGYACRGMGLLQNTGRDGRVRLAHALGADPDQVSAMLVDPGWMLECAAADFVALGAAPYADRDDVEGVTRRINGGLNGLADRRAALAACRKAFPPRLVVQAPAPAPTHQETAAVPPKNDAIAALERIARDPNTVAELQRGIADAQAIAAAIPNSGPLSGYKTYIVAGLGVAGTLAVVAKAVVDGGGLTTAGVLSGITALVASGGLATIRAALAGNHAATADNIASLGAGLAAQIGQGGAAAAEPVDGGRAGGA